MSARVIQPNFITDIIDEDLEKGRVSGVVTRFPPEPNGYAHLGHTFACFLNFSLAADYAGAWVLRMDDTNPLTERLEYVEAIRGDLAWMGWETPALQFASDDFEVMYECAVQLVKKGLAYVDSVSPEVMSAQRGTVDSAGTPSPYRERGVEENLGLLERMRAGEFADGAHLLRAKIDLANPNMKLRDPGLFRILHAEHYRQGRAWCIYPLYDFAQAINDAINGVTHSLCSLEFVDNRAIYDWLLDHLTHPAFKSRPRQYEFGRRSLEYTVVSKRKLRKLVEGGFVAGWDDPRMPTLAAQRRRGVTPQALRAFAGSIGVSRTNRTVDIALLEHAIRDDLNHNAPRVMAVLRPVRLTITNLEAETNLEVAYFPQDVIKDSPDGLVPLPSGERVPPQRATRVVPLTRDLFIERDDISSNPPPGYKRLTLGGRVRLRGAGVVQCNEVIADDAGTVLEARCELVSENEKAGGVIHWVSATHGIPFEARLYDRLFKVPNPEAEAKELEDDEETGDEKDFLSFLNPNSLEVVRGVIEPSVANDPKNARYQFERNGYFWQDQADSSAERLIFNRIITLKDNWTPQTTSSDAATKPRKTISTPETPVGAKHASPASQPTLELSPEEQMQFESLKSRGINDAEALILARDAELHAYLERTGEVAGASGFVIQLGLRDDSRVAPEQLAALVRLVGDGSLSRNMAKTVLERALETGESPLEIVERDGLKQVSDSNTLEPLVDEVLRAHPDKLESYRGGRTGLLGFFVGEVMKRSKGTGNPQVVQTLVKRKLEG
jgi:glutaminyl-tRNA synthetase